MRRSLRIAAAARRNPQGGGETSGSHAMRNQSPQNSPCGGRAALPNANIARPETIRARPNTGRTGPSRPNPARDNSSERGTRRRPRTNPPRRGPPRQGNGENHPYENFNRVPREGESAPAFYNRKRRAQQIGKEKIARNTRAKIRLAALNINGRIFSETRSSKWPEISRIMYEEKIGILAVGETHLSEEQAEVVKEDLACRRLKLFVSIDPEHPNSAGVATVINKDIANVEGIESEEIIC